MRIFVVSRQRVVAKTETEVHEGRGDKVERIPKGISSQCCDAYPVHLPPTYIYIYAYNYAFIDASVYSLYTSILFSANLQDDSAVHDRRLCGRSSWRQ